jgi:hypothetical protein
MARASGRPLGAQHPPTYGAEIAKRVHTYATTINYAATISDITDLDLAYTPPSGSPWDANQLATINWQLQASPLQSLGRFGARPCGA